MNPTARHREQTALLGMILFIASWAMLFASLFFAYALTRLRALAWPPPDLPELPLGLPALGTAALALASAALVQARAVAGGPRLAPRVEAWLAVALGGEVAFLGLQAVVWSACWGAGLRPASGTYASVFYGLTVFHGLHVLVGAAALVVLLARAWRGRLAPLSLRLWALYLHMVGVLWAIMFVGVYLL